MAKYEPEAKAVCMLEYDSKRYVWNCSLVNTFYEFAERTGLLSKWREGQDAVSTPVLQKQIHTSRLYD